MTAKNKYKSPAFEAIHSAASGLFSVGAIPQETMRHFDESCLAKRPSGMSLKLLSVVQKHGLKILL